MVTAVKDSLAGLSEPVARELVDFSVEVVFAITNVDVTSHGD